MDPPTIERLMLSLEEWLGDRPDLRKMIARWIRVPLTLAGERLWGTRVHCVTP
ncbi:MAG: hypothetical protein HKM00_00185 [Gallionella sp.]|nr:hypothetical protein [Gallionella sp.]